MQFRQRAIAVVIAAVVIGGAIPAVAADVNTGETTTRGQQEQQSRDLLGRYRKQIDEFSRRADRETAQIRKELQRDAEDLKKKHKDAARNLEQLRKATDEMWQEVAARLRSSLDELRKAIQHAEGKAKQEEKETKKERSKSRSQREAGGAGD